VVFVSKGRVDFFLSKKRFGTSSFPGIPKKKTSDKGFLGPDAPSNQRKEGKFSSF